MTITKTTLNKARKAKTQENESTDLIKLKFDINFVKNSFEYKQFTFTKRDLPLIEYMASEFVNDPEKNRAKDNDNIFRILRCLITNNWYEEVSDIHVDINGNLKNGQHTLDAVIQWFNQDETPKGASVVIGFKLGTSEDSMPYLDSSRPRNIDQNLTIKHGRETMPINKFMRDVIKFETRRTIHKIDPLNFGGARRINYYEMEDVVNKNQKLLNSLFGELGFPMSDFGGGMRYAIFRLGKKDLKLATEICDEIREVHMANSNKSPKPESDHCNKMEEHSLIEHIRSRKASAKQKEKVYDNPLIYTDVVDWILSKYSKVSNKVFLY